MIKNRKQMFIVIGVFCLTLLLGTVTYAFFNYTRTGTANTIKTGRIAFNTTQNGTLNLTNVFPVASNSVGNDYTQNTVTINITGDTTYANGLEYLVTAEDVHVETTTGKKVPLTLKVAVTSNLGTEDTDNDQIEYYTNRGGNTSYYKKLSESVLYDGQYLLVGYIAPGSNGINGTINIKAYLDDARVAISDTYPEGEVSHTEGEEPNQETIIDGYNGTTDTWVNNRVVLTTNEWNILQQQGNELSFKVRVESNEGTWVDPSIPINSVGSIPSSLKENITEIYFIKETPIRLQQRYDAATVKADMTDTTLNEGKVLGWQEGNKLYIASSGDTYLPADSSGYFANLSNVTKFVFENMNASRITNMAGMFNICSGLTSIDLSGLQTDSVTNMSGMFYGCTSLVSANLNGLGSNSLSVVGGMFNGCTSLKTVNMDNFNFGLSMDGLFHSTSSLEEVSFKNADTSRVTSMKRLFAASNIKKVDLSGLGSSNLTNIEGIFDDCLNLEEVNMSEFNFGTASMKSMFASKTNLKIINLLNANTSNVPSMETMFTNCSSLEKIDLSNLGGNSLSKTNSMFSGCTNLEKINMLGFNFGTSQINGLFSYLSNLEEVNISNANFSNVPSVIGMFENSSNLRTIKASTDLNLTDFSSADSAGMFYNCTSLVGGAGTTYDSNHIDSTYAKVDGGPSNPGYFTLGN